MRLSPTESAQTVLDRLARTEPRRPTFVDPQNKQPRVDRTFEERHGAWRAAVEREKARLEAEKAGKLEEHLEGLRKGQDQRRKLRLQEEKKERVEAAAIRKLAAAVIPPKKKKPRATRVRLYQSVDGARPRRKK